MVTIKDVAQKCGVSIAAVSKAMNHQPGVGAEKAEMVIATAREMGYFPNAAAKTLKTRRSHNIGLLFENGLTHEYFSLILDAVRETAEQHQYDITFLSNQFTSARGSGYYEHARQRQCDGILIVQGNYDMEGVRRLAASEVPFVSIDQVFNGRTAIMSENVGSTQEIVEYLHGLGHTRIAFIHGEMGDVTRQRLAGFYRGCSSCGIEVPDEYVVGARFHEPRDSGLAVRQLLALKQRPTCILFPDDISYLGGLTEIEAHGLSVPQDISCFGYDGIHMASVLRPSLATYRQDAAGIGHAAMENLINAIENPRVYAPEIITIHGCIQPGRTVRDIRETSAAGEKNEAEK